VGGLIRLTGVKRLMQPTLDAAYPCTVGTVACRHLNLLPVAIQQPFGAIATAVTVHVCCVYSCTWERGRAMPSQQAQWRREGLW